MYLHTEVIIIFICNGKYLTIVKKVFTTNHFQSDCIHFYDLEQLTVEFHMHYLHMDTRYKVTRQRFLCRQRKETDPFQLQTR
jgi:hypothetical protein